LRRRDLQWGLPGSAHRHTSQFDDTYRRRNYLLDLFLYLACELRLLSSSVELAMAALHVAAVIKPGTAGGNPRMFRCLRLAKGVPIPRQEPVPPAFKELQREYTRQHPTVRPLLEMFWETSQCDESTGTLPTEQYIEIYLKLAKVLTPGIDLVQVSLPGQLFFSLACYPIRLMFRRDAFARPDTWPRPI
jgi:hypothetical protein